MAEDAAELLTHALKLPPAARAALADSLIDSLDTEVDEDAEEAWRSEIALRVRDLDSGAVQTTRLGRGSSSTPCAIERLMRRSVRFHPAALQDADEAAVWYAERSVRAAIRFLDELDRLIDLIAVSPDSYPSFRYRPSPGGLSPISLLHRLSGRRCQRCRPRRSTREKTPTILA